MNQSTKMKYPLFRILCVLITVFITATLGSCSLFPRYFAPHGFFSNDTITEDLSWTGVYRYDDGNAGELFLISSSSDTEVTGTYVFAYDSGGYGSREFTWSLKTDIDALERFGSGNDTALYHLSGDRIIAHYPEGWWSDRDYIYICKLEEAEHQLEHPYFDNLTEATEVAETIEATEAVKATEAPTSPATDAHPSPFYGIWVFAAKERSDCDSVVQNLKSKGFSAEIYVTTDWSNLNTEKWYVVTAGTYNTKKQAEQNLSNVQSAGYDTAYVKYSGDWKN